MLILNAECQIINDCTLNDIRKFIFNIFLSNLSKEENSCKGLLNILFLYSNKNMNLHMQLLAEVYISLVRKYLIFAS